MTETLCERLRLASAALDDAGRRVHDALTALLAGTATPLPAAAWDEALEAIAALNAARRQAAQLGVHAPAPTDASERLREVQTLCAALA
ncbi:MAG: hypothetical protein KC613_25380, partial [Myxococcales bacterium]|nr:hypothetical protein [Myxococcales bacterium]